MAREIGLREIMCNRTLN